MLESIRHAFYRFKYIHAPKLNLKAPVDVSLELSSFCTNTCGYCYHGDPKKLPFKRGKMAKVLAFKILKESAEIGVHSVKFNYRGESTMNPHFEEITAYARSLANGSTFIDRLTNSNFNFRPVREDIFRGLLNQTKVKVSFDSFIKEIFEKQRAGSKYEETLSNMQRFHDWPGRKTEMVVQSVRTRLNENEDLEHEIKKRFPSATASIRDVVAGRTDKDLSAVVVKERDFDNRQSCIQAHARLMINWDGKVQICCPDISSKLLVGDVNKQHVSDVWNSDTARHYRQTLLAKKAFDFDPCKNCSSYESFKGYKPNWKS
jgi:radical SAM protein with 4Fe4S-binding SPASM domain